MTIRVLTQADYLELWRKIFPKNYTVPKELEAGGQGFDAESAQAKIFEAVTEAVICQTQGYYLKPHSLAVRPIASGATFAKGEVDISRIGNVGFSAPLLAGTRFLATQLGSFGQTVEMAEYQVVTRQDFAPGEVMRTIPVQAVISGYASNIPKGKIQAFSVRGRSLVPNTDVTAGRFAVVESFNRDAGGQDVYSSDMVGQFMRFTNIAVFPPGPRLIIGATVVTVGNAQTTTVEFEPILEDGITPGTPLPNDSGVITEVEEFADVGFVVEQPEPMEGGQTGFLDAIGADRNTPRVTGESDAAYRDRLCNLDDMISPAAMIRICERIMSPLGLGCVIKETRCITPGDDPRFQCLSGFIYDTVGAPNYINKTPALLNAYDHDPQFAIDNGLVWLDAIDMVRFFIMCIGVGGQGDFGFAYDGAADGLINPYDEPAVGINNFYDGSPLVYLAAVGALWQELNAARAGGVGFDIVQVPGLAP